MKKHLVLLLLLASSLAAFSQFRYGLKAGVNYSDLSVTTGSTATLIKNVDAITSWRGGLMAQYALGDFAFQSELMFGIEGGDLLNTSPGSGKLTQMLSTSSSLVSFRSQNLQIPLNVQYGHDFGGIRVYGLVGPYVNFNLGGTLNGSSDLWGVVEDEWGFNKVDMGFGAGLGAEVKKLQLTLRYDFGGTEIGKKSNSTHVPNPFFNMKERNLSLSLGYFF
jgi:hypothetical protein